METLVYTFLLIDIRHDLQKIDIEFMEFLNNNLCPFVIIFTKSDKLKFEKVTGNRSNADANMAGMTPA